MGWGWGHRELLKGATGRLTIRKCRHGEGGGRTETCSRLELFGVLCSGLVIRCIGRTRVMLGSGALASVRTLSRIGNWKRGCCRWEFFLTQAASQWACNMSQGLELAGGQMRGPDKKQTLGNILGVAFAGAQRGVRIKGDSMERLELGRISELRF